MCSHDHVIPHEGAQGEPRSAVPDASRSNGIARRSSSLGVARQRSLLRSYATRARPIETFTRSARGGDVPCSMSHRLLRFSIAEEPVGSARRVAGAAFRSISFSVCLGEFLLSKEQSK